MTSQETPSLARYSQEREFFDRAAAKTSVRPMPTPVLERYAHPPQPHLFSKEYMFTLLGDAKGKSILEIGCGEGIASVQLAYAGARVTALDLSPRSIAVARQRAAVQGFDVDFRQANIETDSFGHEQFDVVWCDLILHHVVPNLSIVMAKIRDALKPGGIFVAREPIMYARWLKSLRRIVPVAVDCTPDEQPLRDEEFRTIENCFPDLKRRYFGIFARIDWVIRNTRVIATAARLDNILFHIPGATRLAESAVIWARK